GKDVTGRVISANKDLPVRAEMEKPAQFQGRSDSADKAGSAPSGAHRADVGSKAGDTGKVGGAAGKRPDGAAGTKGDAAPGGSGKGGSIVAPPIAVPAAGTKHDPVGKEPGGKSIKDGGLDPRTNKDGKGADSKSGRTGEPPTFLPPGLRIGRFFPPD